MTREEAEEAMAIGERRTMHHVRRGTQHKYGLVRCPSDFKMDRLAALAEATVAEYLGLPWTAKAGDGPDAGVDVGTCVSVRHTTLLRGCLIVYPKDQDDLFSVLVTGDGWPTMRVAGWATTGWCKQDRFWRTDRRYPAWFVPQSELKDPRVLRRLLYPCILSNTSL